MYPARSMSTITEGGRHRLRSTEENEREGGRVCKWTAREGALICRWGAIDGRRGGCECSLHFAREWEPLTRFLALVSVALRLFSYSYRPSRITSTCRAALWLTNSCFLRIAVARLSPCHQYTRSSQMHSKCRRPFVPYSECEIPLPYHRRCRFPSSLPTYRCCILILQCQS